MRWEAGEQRFLQSIESGGGAYILTPLLNTWVHLTFIGKPRVLKNSNTFITLSFSKRLQYRHRLPAVHRSVENITLQAKHHLHNTVGRGHGMTVRVYSGAVMSVPRLRGTVLYKKGLQGISSACSFHISHIVLYIDHVVFIVN